MKLSKSEIKEIKSEIKHIEWVLEQHSSGTLCGFDKIIYEDRIPALTNCLKNFKIILENN
jgi:ASC-1-like (ASCH) protein